MGLTQKLGTIPLAIQTDSSNNVGIGGAANASYKLDVIGNGKFTSSNFPIDIYGTTNNYGLRINSVQAPTLLLYSSNANSSNRNWGIFTNSEVYGDFDIRQSNAKDGDMTVGANSTSRLYIRNNGNVGINTTTPNVSGQSAGVGVLTIKGSTSWGGVEVQNNANTADGLLLGFYGFTNSGITGNSAAGMPAYIGSWLSGTSGADNGAEIRFFTKGNGGQTLQRMTISNTGYVGIGVSPALNLHIATSGTAFTSTTVNFSSSTSRGIFLDQSNGASDNGNAIWFGNSGLYSAIASTREFTGDWGTDIRFYTHPKTTTNQFQVTERMRITGDGNVFIGGTSIQNSPKFSVIGSGVWDGAAIGLSNTGSSGLVYTMFSTNSSFSQGAGNFLLYNNNNAVNCLIVYPNGNYVFAGSNVSDARLKQDIKDISFGLNEIMQLSPKSYNIKSENNLDGDNVVNLKKNYGFIAQEVKNILPEIITGQETETEYLGIDYNSILALAVKAIQELNQKVTALENK